MDNMDINNEQQSAPDIQYRTNLVWKFNELNRVSSNIIGQMVQGKVHIDTIKTYRKVVNDCYMSIRVLISERFREVIGIPLEKLINKLNQKGFNLTVSDIQEIQYLISRIMYYKGIIRIDQIQKPIPVNIDEEFEKLILENINDIRIEELRKLYE